MALGILVLVVAGVTVAVTRGDHGPDASVGLASDDNAGDHGDPTATSPVAPPATLPEIRPAAWAALGGRFALGLDGQLVLVDGTTGNADTPAARIGGRADRHESRRRSRARAARTRRDGGGPTRREHQCVGRTRVPRSRR